jgi:hypothetical protein
VTAHPPPGATPFDTALTGYGFGAPSIQSVRHSRTFQQDIEDNKYLATILRTIQTAQLARDEKKLAKATLRERPALKRSIDERRAGEAK